MSANSAPAKTGGKNLAFTSVRAGRCTAYGVVRDSKGNAFDIEIKGTDEKAVRKFIRYELQQAKQGRGIKVKIEPSGKILPPKHGKPPERVHGQARWNGISMKIREKSVKAKKPYKLHVEVDPPLDPLKSQDYTFDNQTTANVKIDVTFGSATVQLFEFINPLKTKSVPTVLKTGEPGFDSRNYESFTISAGEERVFASPSHYTQDWNFRVIAGENGATFTIVLDIVVT